MVDVVFARHSDEWGDSVYQLYGRRAQQRREQEEVRIVTSQQRSGRRPGLRGEISTYNPNVMRGQNGIWNEDTVPVTEWEAPEHRVVIPTQLRKVLGKDVPAILRWSVTKYRDVMVKHPRDEAVVRDLSRHLETWSYVGKEPGTGHCCVLFHNDDGRWYQASLGYLQESFNVATVFGGSEDRFLRKRLKGLEDIVERMK